MMPCSPHTVPHAVPPHYPPCLVLRQLPQALTATLTLLQALALTHTMPPIPCIVLQALALTQEAEQDEKMVQARSCCTMHGMGGMVWEAWCRPEPAACC